MFSRRPTALHRSLAPSRLLGALLLTGMALGAGQVHANHPPPPPPPPPPIAWLHLPQFRTAIRVNGMTSLALTKLDTLSGIHPIKVCTAYRHKGKRLSDFPVSRRAQLEVEPVYESFPGFSGDISGARRFSDLPLSARAYILQIERWLGLPVSIVSVGQSRDQTIIRDKKFLQARNIN